MKKAIRKALCIVLSVAVISSSFLCLAVGYPDGVTKEMCEESSVKTDVLIENAMGALSEKSLKETVSQMLLKDETLSSLLTGIYSSLSQSESVLKIAGIDVSVKNLAVCLSAYPQVSKKLSDCSGWSELDLSGVKWGIKDASSFADAVGSIFAPFNDVLYMLLCSGRYKAGIISIPGDDGYGKGLISMLSALGCTYIAPADVFKYEAYYNRNKMISLITLSLLSAVDAILSAPSEKLCATLPVLADYIKNGGLEKSVNALLRPLTIHIGDYIQLFTGSQMISFIMFIQDPSKYTLRFSENITLVMNEMLQSSEVTLPEIDLDALISCKDDRGGAYCLIMTWIIDLLKLNGDKIKELVPAEEGTEEIFDIADKLLQKETDDLFALIVSLFTAKEGRALEYQWQTHEYTKTQAQYIEGIGEKETARILDGIDETIDGFIVEMAGGEPLSKTIKNAVYSNSLVTSLTKGLYGALSSKETATISDVLSLPKSPYQLSLYLKEASLRSARSSLSRYSKWDKIENINWGFRDGDSKGFIKALVAVLRPLEPALEAFLANGTVKLFDSVNLSGTNGYNTAVIPLLEALGCPSKKIKTYSEYIKGRGTDSIIEDIITPITALVDKVAKRPVYNLTAILPNVLFFIDNGSLMQCIDNLLYPLNELLGEPSVDMKSLGFDIDEIKNTDIISKLTQSASSLIEGIDIGKPDLKKLEGMGEKVSVKSKRTYNGELTEAEYIEADRNAVLITIITYVVDLLGQSENSSLMDSFMGGGSGSGGMFDQYSSGMGEEMANMTTEETIKWLYDLFFYERATVETTQEEFTETIIYVPQEKPKHSPVPVIIAVILLLSAGAFVFVRRESIIEYIDEKRNNERVRGNK